MQKKYKIILSAEEDLARAVALGVLVKRPITAWHFLIPGMFIFDFLRRSSEIKKYSDLFLFPRKHALNAALEMWRGGDRNNILYQIEGKISEWLTSLKLHSPKLLDKHLEQINLFIEHYSKIMNAEGNNYYSLVRNAYKTRDNYEEYLSRLSSTEQELDSAIAEMFIEDKNIGERLQSEKLQLEELRKKEVERVF